MKNTSISTYKVRSIFQAYKQEEKLFLKKSLKVQLLIYYSIKLDTKLSFLQYLPLYHFKGSQFLFSVALAVSFSFILNWNKTMLYCV